MNAFDSARGVEARSMKRLLPFMESQNGRFVLTEKGFLAKLLQETCGDILFNDAGGRLWGVELKAERRFTGNLFLETWSNRNLENRQSHATRGSNVGWLYKTQADLLFYHFLDTDSLVIVQLFPLKRWAFCEPSRKRGERAGAVAPDNMVGRLFDFPEREQQQYDQLNDTRGRLVPIKVLEAEMSVPPVLRNVGQLELLLAEHGGLRRAV